MTEIEPSSRWQGERATSAKSWKKKKEDNDDNATEHDPNLFCLVLSLPPPLLLPLKLSETEACMQPLLSPFRFARRRKAFFQVLPLLLFSRLFSFS